MPPCGYEFYLLVFKSIFHEREQRKSEISSWTLEDKIHMHKRASNILYVYKYVILEFFCERHQIKSIF